MRSVEGCMVFVLSVREGCHETKNRAYWYASIGERVFGPFRTPFFGMARELKREGVDDRVMLEMQHVGPNKPSYRQAIGEAASLTVVETDKVGPIIKRYQPVEMRLPQ